MKIEEDIKAGLTWITFDKKDLKGIRNMKKRLDSENLLYTITEDVCYNTIFFEVYHDIISYEKYLK